MSNILQYSMARRMISALTTGEPSSVKATAAALDESADLGQLLAFAALGDGADGKDVGIAGAFGLQVHELGGRLTVEGRLGVGHARHRRDAASQRRRRAGADRLVLLTPRLAQMDVHVDEAWTDDLAGGIEGAIGLRRGMWPHAEDVFAANPHVANLIEVLRGINDSAIGNADGNHNRLFYTESDKAVGFSSW